MSNKVHEDKYQIGAERMKRVQTLLTENYGKTTRCTDGLLEDYGDKIESKEE